MAVYVDPLHKFITDDAPLCFRRSEGASHLYADSDEELHEFALRLGLKRSWHQNNPRLSHYDLVKSKYVLALRLGAIQHDRIEAINFWKTQRLERLKK